MINRHYYTLKDFILFHEPTLPNKLIDALDVGDNYKYNNKYLLLIIAESLFDNDVLGTTRNWMSETCGKVFCQYIYRDYKNMSIGYIDSDTEPTTAQKKALYKEFFRVITSRLDNTYDEYKKLIDLYDSIKSDLLKRIGSKSQTKYNDTPQSQTTAGVVSYDDTYNTNVSTNYSETDGMSPIARLAEVEKLIRDYYEKWCNTVCRGLFIYE